MDLQQLLAAVRDTAGVSSQQEAEQAAMATLKALGERISGGETKDLAAQLPAPLDRALPAAGGGQRFGIEEFYERVASYEGSDDPRDARRHARAVVAALKASITGGEFDQIQAQLPQEYGDLLGTDPVQH